MVVTIEPGKCCWAYELSARSVSTGIYVPQSPLFPKEFHNIGIRIEVNVNSDYMHVNFTYRVCSQDEVLVGTDRPTVLSVAAPKEVCALVTQDARARS